MRLDTQSFFFFFFFYVFEKQRKSLLHTLNCYGKASLLFSIVPFLGNICISIHLVCIFFLVQHSWKQTASIEEISSSCISTFWSLTLISVGALYMHVTLFSRLTAKNNMKGSIGTTIVAIENRQDVFAPLFSFFLCFFFLRYWRQLVDKKNGGLVLPSIMVLLMLTMAIDASILFCSHPLLIGHCMLLFPRRCC